MGRVLIVSDTPVPGHGLEAERLLHRVRLLSRRGGGTLVAPASPEGPMLETGVRHVPLAIPPGLPWQRREAMVDDLLGPYYDRLRPKVVHCLGLRPAVPALLRRLAGVRVVVEPGITPAQRLRDEQPQTSPARLESLVELEDKTLTRADAVIARSPVEAATLAARGVSSGCLWTIRDGPPPCEVAPLPDLPHVLYLGDLAPWSGWEVLLEALSRIRDLPWRLSMVLPVECSTGVVEHAARARRVENRVAFHHLGEGTEAFLQSAQLVVCPFLSTRATRAGSAVPESVLWALAAGRPILAADLPVVRAYAGEAAAWFEPGDAGALKEALVHLLGAPAAREGLLEQGAARRANLDWDAAEAVLGDLWSALLQA